MTLAELRARVRTLTNVHSSALISDSDIDDALNEALEDLSDLYDWPFQMAFENVSVVPGTSSYALAVNTARTLSVVNTTDSSYMRKLREISMFDADAMADATPDLPRRWRVEGTTLYLYPVPSAAETLTVRSTTTVARLSSDTDEPVFAAQFHPVLAYLASAQLLEDRARSVRKVQRMMDTALRFIDRMRRMYIMSSEHGVSVSGSRRGS